MHHNEIFQILHKLLKAYRKHPDLNREGKMVQIKYDQNTTSVWIHRLFSTDDEQSEISLSCAFLVQHSRLGNCKIPASLISLTTLSSFRFFFFVAFFLLFNHCISIWPWSLLRVSVVTYFLSTTSNVKRTDSERKNTAYGSFYFFVAQKHLAPRTATTLQGPSHLAVSSALPAWRVFFSQEPCHQ